MIIDHTNEITDDINNAQIDWLKRAILIEITATNIDVVKSNIANLRCWTLRIKMNLGVSAILDK